MQYFESELYIELFLFDGILFLRLNKYKRNKIISEFKLFDKYLIFDNVKYLNSFI